MSRPMICFSCRISGTLGVVTYLSLWLAALASVYEISAFTGPHPGLGVAFVVYTLVIMAVIIDGLEETS